MVPKRRIVVGIYRLVWVFMTYQWWESCSRNADPMTPVGHLCSCSPRRSYIRSAYKNISNRFQILCTWCIPLLIFVSLCMFLSTFSFHSLPHLSYFKAWIIKVKEELSAYPSIGQTVHCLPMIHYFFCKSRSPFEATNMLGPKLNHANKSH